MEDNLQPPQNGVTTQAPEKVPAPIIGEAKPEEYNFDYSPVEETFQRHLFPTLFASYKFTDWEQIAQPLINLSNGWNVPEEDIGKDIMELDHPAVNRLKEVIYEICESIQLSRDDAGRTPVIVGSNTLFQQGGEHIPPHNYEFSTLVFTFIANCGQNPPTTYFPDPRGGVQAIRKMATQNLVSTSFGINSRIGEIYVTPGYAQRYVETNLESETHVLINVRVNFLMIS